MSKKLKIYIVVFVALLLAIGSSCIFLSKPLFSDPFSTVVFERNGELLGARVAHDEQWRFPKSDTIPQKFIAAICLREDKHFFNHPGFNPVSIFNALVDNIKSGKVVRGGSTITMQTIRLSRKGQSRTIGEKLIELYLSLGLELTYSKSEILAFYCAHAPFGGNVVGLEAAAWRYFGHEAARLSWAEAATLAVLPNAPSLIHPGKNRNLLKMKRDLLLEKIYREGLIDSLTLKLARIEQIPEKPVLLPQNASHLVSHYNLRSNGKRIAITIDGILQERVNAIVEAHHQQLQKNGIHNAAVLVLDPTTYEVLAYVANTKPSSNKFHGNAVDMIRAKRSTGSILKPLLYAAMLDDGLLMPDAFIPDIPSYYENYHPENFDLTFEGAVPASQALSRSRNVPSVYMLRDYGGARFLHLLRRVGITSFSKAADYYGLTLILGGGEASLWELTNMYAGMARTVLNYDRFYRKYTGKEYDPAVLEQRNVRTIEEPKLSADIPLHAGSIWQTYQALNRVKRPGLEAGWSNFSSELDIAWKTGTSYGFKDAWAIGTTANYIVGVWVGNADGEGRDGLIGTTVAAPLMFEIFSLLKTENKFYPPHDELLPIEICAVSGHRASRYCHEIDTILSYEKGIKSKQCSYHKLIFTDADENFRLSQQCASVADMKAVSWFVLPPVQEWYFRKSHATYKTLPKYAPGCKPEDEDKVIEFIYPTAQSKLFVALGLTGEQQEIVFEISHRFPGQKVYWHLDNVYLGETQSIHELGFIPDKGWHSLTVADELGNSNTVSFEVVNKSGQ